MKKLATGALNLTDQISLKQTLILRHLKKLVKSPRVVLISYFIQTNLSENPSTELSIDSKL